MGLDPDGGIAIRFVAERANGVPLENWLPVVRQDEHVDMILRVYVPDLERMTGWTVPKAEVGPGRDATFRA